MRTNLLMLAAAIVLAGCSTSSQYRTAARELHVTEMHVWCWAPIADASAYGKCDLTDAPELAETACVDQLASRGQRPSSLNSAKDEIEACMRADGWRLEPFVLHIFAPDTYNATSECVKQYGWERCPQMPASAR